MCNVNEFVGRTFSYNLGVQNILCIVHVTGFEPKGEKFLSDSYVGKSFLLDNNGDMYGSITDWSCACEYFEKYELLRIR